MNILANATVTELRNLFPVPTWADPAETSDPGELDYGGETMITFGHDFRYAQGFGGESRHMTGAGAVRDDFYRSDGTIETGHHVAGGIGIDVWINGNCAVRDHLDSAEQARGLATALLQAADDLDKIVAIDKLHHECHADAPDSATVRPAASPVNEAEDLTDDAGREFHGYVEVN